MKTALHILSNCIQFILLIVCAFFFSWFCYIWIYLVGLAFDINFS